MIATASPHGQATQTERRNMAVNTATLIQRLIDRANMHDTFGRSDEGDILREAAAALAEAKNEKVIGNMLVDILKRK
jgi:hypothetical protein